MWGWPSGGHGWGVGHVDRGLAGVGVGSLVGAWPMKGGVGMAVVQTRGGVRAAAHNRAYTVRLVSSVARYKC